MLTQRLESLVAGAVADGVAPAIACAVVLHGTAHPVVTAGAATAETLFDLASITKVFSTVTALSLVDDGVLGLDAPVADVLPSYRSGAKSAVTLRQLLTHTAGLPAEWRGWERSVAAPRPWSRPELLADLLSTELVAAPGTVMQYSCAGFNTVMALAELATGRSWASLMHERVLARLPTRELTGTPPPQRCAPTELVPQLGRGLIRGVVHDEAAWSLGGLSGNAGLFATAPALAVAGEALRAGLPGLLSPALAAELWAPQLQHVLGHRFDPRNPGFGQGLGVRINQQPWMGAHGAHARGHGGFTGTSLLVDRRRGVTISLLSNRVSPSRSGDDATSLRRAVSDLVYQFAPSVAP